MGSRRRKHSNEETTRGLMLAPLAEMPVMGTEWLWQDRIALESVTLVMGNPGAGKSQLAMDLAARVSLGRDWPDGAPSRGAGDVMMLCAEDHLLRRVRPTLAGIGADFARFHFPFQSSDDWNDETASREIHLKRDLDLVEEGLRQAPGIKLLVIDSFQQFMGSARGLDTVSVLRRLDRWATKYRLAVLVVTHLRPGGGEAVHRAVGGAALTTLARAIWLVVRPELGRRRSGIRGQEAGVSLRQAQVREKRKTERRLFLPVKNNLAEEGWGLAFAVTKRAQNLVSTVEWLEGEVETTADEALCALRRKAIADSQSVAEAMEFLEEALAGGPRPAKDVTWEGKEVQGLSAASLKRGRKTLKVHAFQPTIPGPWWICLKDDVQGKEACMREKAAPLEPLGKNTGNNGVFPEAQAAPLEPLGKMPVNCDEIKSDECKSVAPLGEIGADLTLSGERGAAGFLAGVIAGSDGKRPRDVA